MNVLLTGMSVGPYQRAFAFCDSDRGVESASRGRILVCAPQGECGLVRRLELIVREAEF
jgi:hypothetical protein